MGLGTAMMGAGGLMAGGMIASAKAAADFQSQLTLLTTHAGATVGQMKELGGYILKVAGQLGFDPTSLAEAVYHVQSVLTSLPANLRTVATDEEVLYRAAQLAAIGHADLEDSVNAVSKAFVVYQKDGYTAQQITAIFNKTIGEGNMRLQELNTAFATGLLPVAEQAGLKLESVGAALATMTDAGIPAARAATYLRSALIQMSIPSNQAVDALAAIGVASNTAKSQVDTFNQVLVKAGVNQTDVAKVMQKTGSLGDTLTWLKQKIEAAGLSSQDAAALLDRSFGGIRSGTGVVTLYNTLQGLVQKEKDAKDSTSEWTETWKKFTQLDPNFAINQLHASWNSLVIVLGYSFLPILLRIVQNVTPLVERLGLWVAKNSDLVASIAQQATIFLLVGGAITFVSGVIGRIIGFVIPIIEFFAEFGAQIAIAAEAVDEFGIAAGASGGVIAGVFGGPVTIAILAIGALIAIGILLVTHWNQVKAAAFMIWGMIAPYITQAISYIRSIVQVEMSWILSIWNEHHKQIMVVAQAAWAIMKVLFIGVILDIVISIGIVIAAIAAVIIIIVALGAGILWVASKFMDLVQFISAFVVTAWTHLGSFFENITMGSSRAWTEFARHPAYWLGYILGVIIATFNNILGNIVAWLNSIVEAGVRGWISFTGGMVNIVNQLPGQFWNIISRIPGLWIQFTGWLVDIVNRGAQWIVSVWINGLNQLPGAIYNIGRDIVIGLWNGIASLAGWLEGNVSSFVHGLVQGMKDTIISGSPSMLVAREIGIPMSQGVALGMQMDFSNTKNTAKNLLLGSIDLMGSAAKSGAAASSGRPVTIENHSHIYLDGQRIMSYVETVADKRISNALTRT